MARKQPDSRSSTPDGRFAYEGLERVLHEKARLSIMTSLTTQSEALSFSDLRSLCSLSDGNLNRHLAVLQEAGYVDIEKEGRGRSSRSLCRVTRAGRAAFLQYLQELERVLSDAAGAEPDAQRAAQKLRAGWSAS